MSEWIEHKLGKILKPKGYIRGPFGSALKRGEMKESGIPVYEQVNAIYDSREFRYFIDKKKFQELRRFQVQTNDLLISCSGTVGKISIIQENDPKGIISQALLILRPDTKKVKLKFLYYFFNSREGFYQLTQASHGSVQVNIAARKIVEQIPILLPPLHEQEAITAVLSALDDKIDLLHRQNKTLESMAQALFRHWFIDNADGDWEEGCLGDVAENVRNSAKHNHVPSGTIYIGLEHIDKKRIALNHHGFSDDINSNKYWFEDNDILFGKLRPYFHKVCFAPFSGICSTDILVLRPKKPHYFCFCLFAFFQDDVIEYANFASGGTRMPRVNWKTLSEYQIAIPSDEAIKQFDNLVYPSIEKIKLNLKQIRTLENLRDTLLPKLMSGQVRVRL